MKKKLLFAPIIALSCLVASCWSGGGGSNSGWDANIKQTMLQEFGMVIPYVTGLDVTSVHFRPDYNVLDVEGEFDNSDEAYDFVTSYYNKMSDAGFDGGTSAVSDGYYGCFNHTTDKTIVVSGETITEQLWVEFNIYPFGDEDDYAIDLIAYLSGDFATFPLDSLCEILHVSDTYKSSIPTFPTSYEGGYRIKGYVPGDIYFYVVTVDVSGLGTLFNNYTQALRNAGFTVNVFPGDDELKATGAKQVDGLGTIEVHYYDVANYFYGGFIITH